MSHQFILDLPVRPALGRDDFFESECNSLVLKQIDSWTSWAGGKLILTGPAGSGKSHLAAVWAELAGAQICQARELSALQDLTQDEACNAVAIEDVDRIVGQFDVEEAIFHLHNALMSRGGSLMITGRESPLTWDFGLPDLASRIIAADVAKLGMPDDNLLAALLVKLFTDRQLHVEPQVVSYLTSRIGRSFAQAEDVVMRLDQEALRTRRRITRPFARSVVERGADF